MHFSRALDLNRGARMYEVQVTGDTSSQEPEGARSDRGCALPGATFAMEINSELTISQNRHPNQHPGVGLIARPFAAASRQPRSRTCERTKAGIMSLLRQTARVAGYCALTDIFVARPLGEFRIFKNPDAPLRSRFRQSASNATVTYVAPAAAL